MIDFTKAQYSLSAHLAKQMPADNGVEVAFAGRSNVGKSSAINAITNHRGLAKTSKTPGRTQQINFFDLDSERRLVDLPGYGYAKAPEHLRKHWGQFLTDYIATRTCLVALVLPMDIRRPFTDLDNAMLSLCWKANCAVHILLTKSDKFGRGKSMGILQKVQNEIRDHSNTSVQLFSALNKQGVDEARQAISALFLAETNTKA